MPHGMWVIERLMRQCGVDEADFGIIFIKFINSTAKLTIASGNNNFLHVILLKNLICQMAFLFSKCTIICRILPEVIIRLCHRFKL